MTLDEIKAITELEVYEKACERHEMFRKERPF